MTGVWSIYWRRKADYYAAHHPVDTDGRAWAVDDEFDEQRCRMEGVDAMQVLALLIDRCKTGDQIVIDCELEE